MDSSQSSYRFVRVDEFTLNSGSPWTSFGNVSSVTLDPNNGPAFTFQGFSPAAGLTPPFAKIYILGPATFRVPFNPRNTTGDYFQDGSYAVVNKKLGDVQFEILQNDSDKFSLKLSPDVRVDVLLRSFAVRVFLKAEEED